MEIQQPGPAIVEGLGFVGTGKKGSDTCPPEVITKVLAEAEQIAPPMNTLGAFFGGLWMKGVAPQEKAFEKLLSEGALSGTSQLLSHFSQGVPESVVVMAETLLEGKILTRSQAQQIGEFLFAHTPGDAMRTLIATVLRVRYANPQEYAGLLDVLEAQYPESFQAPVPEGPPILQLADPFDGVERSFILTPLLMKELSAKGYRVVAHCGRNPGPKNGHNLLDLANALPDSRFLTGNSQLAEENPQGWFLRQQDVSPALDRWVEIRHQIKKRPSLATLEKYLSPFKAQVFVGSAFHHNFGEKMIEIAEELEFPAALVTFKTIEGSLGMSLARAARVYGTKKQANGSYERFTLEVHPTELGLQVQGDQKDQGTNLADNQKLVNAYLETGSSGNQYFDDRIRMTLGVFDLCLARVMG